MQMSIKLNYILYMYYKYLIVKSIQLSIINAAFWLVELYLIAHYLVKAKSAGFFGGKKGLKSSFH